VGVKGIQGCFYNVMGFPVAKFYRELSAFCQG
jgi:predicted house-cleaning NTP pyrophosphatase (Maf/HAM1 superfamily)